MPAEPVFVLDADDLVGWQEPDVEALAGEAGLVGFVEVADLTALLEAWAALPGVSL